MVLLLRIFKLTLVFIALSNLAFGQEWQWVQRAGNSSFDAGEDVAVDRMGNSYVTGRFEGTITFGIFKLTSEDKDLFIVKYDTNGQVLWAQKAGGIGSDIGYAIAVDAAGNCYLTGYVQDLASFNSITLKSNVYGSAFIAKYNTNGNILWATIAEGDSSGGLGIALDALGNSWLWSKKYDGCGN